MAERTINFREALSDPDFLLATAYATGELDDEQVAEVRRRLEDDPAFRDFAAPFA